MLSSFIMAGIPMAALLAAAFYIYYRSKPTDHHGPQPQMPFSWNRAPAQSGVRRRRVRSTGDDTHSSSDSPDVRFAEEEHCEICFESVPCVRLYPCNHTDICADCVNKIITTPERLCPFCRCRINGYAELTRE